MYNLAKSKTDYHKALEHLNKCISLITPSNQFYYRYAIVKANTLILSYKKTSDKQYLSQGIEEYERIRQDKPNSISVLNNLAYLLADDPQSLTKAQQYGEQAYMLAPNNPNIIDTYAYTLCKGGDYSKAKELLQTAIQIHEALATAIPWEVHEHLGMAFEGLNENEDAVASYRRAIEVGGVNIDAEKTVELNESIERLLQ
jgi:tetratricopeptide (TPR) repeat protein